MDLSDMTLAPATFQEYTEPREFWYNTSKKNPENFNFARITSPLRARNYHEWVEFFLAHPKGDAISVYDGIGWRKYYPKRFAPQNLEEINELAINDIRGVGNVELSFRWRNKHMDHKSRYTRSIKIRLAQRGKEVVGYDAEFSVEKAYLFKWESPPTFTKDRVCGLWIPSREDNSQ